ncbi:pyridoxal phosphate-dependent decarboxylase family protein [Amycolatopsis azurea]|uniref:Aspartate aminotransferase family protein n=1 Tax=Amycolatopsis azurea DSM 43854 TaxID=1238180 RepID=M2QV94_9PSEU|nr:aminotransferase class V-fold PLP-dependent enzyme [Amycolatopsis azurea]EMD29902.1 Pyridoxal-dependent decarboxylase [Amycolatopsis azurea DSM 43854]OOC04850.1 aspartate aminotransferase family protein [Amycolatopsis azurea DSM 43854]
MTAEDVLAELRELRAGDLPTHGGRTLAYVYDSGLSEVDELGAVAHALASSANGLDPTAFPSLLRMENDLVGTAARLLGGTAETVGSVTSGGTESCMLAVLAARDARPDVSSPTIVLPTTAHAAFHKAAHFFGVRAVPVPVDPVTFRAVPEAMAAAVDDSTVLVVASAPSYAHGVLDPVAEIAALLDGVRFHVDACIGGWVLPYLDGGPFGFDVPGVTSVSVDLHKYAYCPKGVSVLLHADAGLRRSQYFASADWPGYTMLNTTLQSTRSGGPLAAAWAVVRHVGDEGYAKLAAAAREAAVEIRAGVEALEGLRVLGDPVSTLLAFTVDADAGFDLFTVADEMRERGWYVQPQFAHESSPANLHLTVTAANRGSETEFLADLAASVEAARESGPVVVDPQVAEFVAALDPATLTPEQFAGLLAAAGLGGEAGLPTRMAEINALLATAPGPLRERLLLEFLGALYTAS